MRQGVGALIILVVAVLFVLGVILLAQSYLGSSVGDQVKRNLRVEEARMLADSATDEAVARIAADVGGAGKSPAWQLFHDPSKDAFDVAIPELPAFQALLKNYPLHRDPAPVLTARVLFQRFFDQPTTRLKLHEDRFGTLEVTATVPYVTERGAAKLKLVKRFEFKTVHLVPPAPWDRTQFYVHLPQAFLHRGTAAEIFPGHAADDVNQLLVDCAFVVQSGASELARRADAFRDMKQKVDDVKGKPGAPAWMERLSTELGSLEAAFRAGVPAARLAYTELQTAVDLMVAWRVGSEPPTLFGLPLVTYVFPGLDKPEYPLAELNLPGIAEKLVAPIKPIPKQLALVKEEFEALARRIEGGSYAPIEPAGLKLLAIATAQLKACRELLDGYGAFQRRVIQRRGDEEAEKFGRWYEALTERAWINSPAGAGTSGTGSVRAGKAQFIVGTHDELQAIFARYGPSFRGVVMVDNAGGDELVLDGTKPAPMSWSAFDGRLVLAVTGDCTLKEVKRKDPAQHALTVICSGKLTLDGAVESSLVAHGSIARPANGAPPRITGNLVVADSVFNGPQGAAVLDGAVVVKDERIAYWSDGTGTVPAFDTVLFAPAPVYVAVTRQVN